MNNNLTDITVLLDRSGSMSSRKQDVIGGFKEFVNKQKAAPGECRLTLIQFDDENSQEVVYDAVGIGEVPSSMGDWYQPRGGTPLLDALGKAIVNTGARLRAMQESYRPSKVVFVVITDGHENASREYKRGKIKEMVERQQDKYAWDFVFLGANIDAIGEGASLGAIYANSANFSMNNIGSTISGASAKLATYRGSRNKVDLGYSTEERARLVADDKPNQPGDVESK